VIAVGAALVGLAGGVQEARAEFGAGCDVMRVAHRKPHLLQRADRAGVSRDIGEQGDIVAVVRARKMRLDPGAERAVRACLAQLGGVVRVGVEIGLVGRNDRLLCGQRTGLLERSCQLAGLDLGCFHVGLVERVDAEDRARHGGRHLKAEKFLADVVDRFHDDAGHGMPGFLERLEPVVMRGVVFAFGADIDEEAVVAVKRGIAERLTVDRDQALAVLAGGFGDQLFGPGAEIGDLLRGGNRHLVAAFEAGEPHRQPELHAGVFMGRHIGAAGAHHRERVRDQAANVDTSGSRRHQPERR
jgi:hypothetical protein